MERNIYTFKDLIEKYHWDIQDKRLSTNDRKIAFACQNGVLIEPTQEQRQRERTFWIIQDGLQLYTFKEICEKYHWNFIQSKPLRLNAAATKGVILKEYPHNLYEIIEDNSQNVYTWQELIKKYNWTKQVANGVNKKIEYAKNRGVTLRYTGNSNGIAYYEIIQDDSIKGDWVSCEKYPDLEFNKNGYIRNKMSKRVYCNESSSDGYVQVPANGMVKKAHRLIMEVFNPIEDMDNFYVDHINGKRSDNRLENLRWVTPEQNNLYKQENWELIYDNLNKLITKYGYEQVNIWIKELMRQHI